MVLQKHSNALKSNRGNSIKRGPRCCLLFCLILACLSAYCGPVGEATFDETIEPDKIHTVEISDPDQALTFVRIERYGKKRVNWSKIPFAHLETPNGLKPKLIATFIGVVLVG